MRFDSLSFTTEIKLPLMRVFLTAKNKMSKKKLLGQMCRIRRLKHYRERVGYPICTLCIIQLIPKALRQGFFEFRVGFYYP
jgi:hypothetical protein